MSQQIQTPPGGSVTAKRPQVTPPPTKSVKQRKLCRISASRCIFIFLSCIIVSCLNFLMKITVWLWVQGDSVTSPGIWTFWWGLQCDWESREMMSQVQAFELSGEDYSVTENPGRWCHKSPGSIFQLLLFETVSPGHLWSVLLLFFKSIITLLIMNVCIKMGTLRKIKFLHWDVVLAQETWSFLCWSSINWS